MDSQDSEKEKRDYWVGEVYVQQGWRVGSNPKEEGVTEIHLTGVAGEKVPANGKNDEYIGEDKDTEVIRVLHNSGDNE